jgi:hypothetical protein
MPEQGGYCFFGFVKQLETIQVIALSHPLEGETSSVSEAT